MLIGAYFALAGLAFLWLEFYLPGGFFGLISLLALCGALSTWAAAGWTTSQLFAGFAISMGSAALLSALALKSLQRGAAIESKSEKGHVAAQYRLDLIGCTGRAVTDLSPSGLILVESERLAAISQGGFIGRGAGIRVVGGEGFSLLVALDE